ncbi:2-hydroxy-6-oxononadienedioate/2-hydroxy-6-oxononatrienedioate hydrolase [Chryseobacterium taklimakanense]|uniref:2-hydroxy-6-oxononadienedioate/2-hydroxy-6-oxonon atrienedioate hydrolase n=1 Tax=Chryseobacterium taklimakanense TaxID=536441 RepID=A0A239XCF6_9FLAO|nr:alpha/beta hydrolase [Chryseobacterium taklimakanense]SNV43724.1 2-hydroxy-6-oxononadienedioate/2-hydroxy-6-oxononatrienedioate hydrolase [Chryseobacterium taklimakanense]
MLNYEITGNGSENLVMLHGFMENLLIWDDMEQYLSKKFRLIKIDLPGHGRSDIYGEVHTMELMAEKVKEVTDKLQLENFHLLGHSMGGYTSLAFAEKYPEVLKSVTLFFSTFFSDDEEKKEQRRKSFRIILENFRTYVAAGIPNLFNPNEKDILEGKIELAKDIALSTKPEGALACVKGMIERTDKKQVLENLDAKILVIAGKHDNAVKTEVMIKNLPDKTNIKSYILDCGHNGHWEKPEVCAAIINTELLHNLPKHFVF